MREAHVCPRCFSLVSEQDNIRTAQFGGATGGQPNSFSPGTSPMGQGSSGSKNYGINDFGADKTFDSILTQTHNPPQIDEHRNMEKRLEIYHKHQEDDMIPYWLTPEEREKLSIKKNIRRRHDWLEQSKHMVDTNSVPYVKNNYPAKPEHMTSMESQLASQHKYKNVGQKLKFEDELPEVIKPERTHTAQVVNHGRSNPFWDETQRDAEEEELNPNFDNIRMQYPLGVGNAKTLDSGEGLDEYLNEAYKANWGGAEGPREPVLMDIPNADNIGSHSWGFGEKLPSSVRDEIDNELDAFKPLESQLEETKKQPSPERNPNDPYSYWSEWEMAKGANTPGEQMGFADKYSGGSFNPSPIPRS